MSNATFDQIREEALKIMAASPRFVLVSEDAEDGQISRISATKPGLGREQLTEFGMAHLAYCFQEIERAAKGTGLSMADLRDATLGQAELADVE